MTNATTWLWEYVFQYFCYFQKKKNAPAVFTTNNWKRCRLTYLKKISLHSKMKLFYTHLFQLSSLVLLCSLDPLRHWYEQIQLHCRSQTLLTRSILLGPLTHLLWKPVLYDLQSSLVLLDSRLCSLWCCHSGQKVQRASTLPLCVLHQFEKLLHFRGLHSVLY